MMATLMMNDFRGKWRCLRSTDYEDYDADDHLRTGDDNDGDDNDDVMSLVRKAQ